MGKTVESRGNMWPYMTRRLCLGPGDAQAGGSRVAGRCCGPFGTPACVVAFTCCGPRREDAGNRECRASLPQDTFYTLASRSQQCRGFVRHVRRALGCMQGLQHAHIWHLPPSLPEDHPVSCQDVSQPTHKQHNTKAGSHLEQTNAEQCE